MTRMVVIAASSLLTGIVLPSHSAPDLARDIEKIVIESAATANDKPVGTFNSPVSNLEYDPRMDLQSRNMAEAQADVTIRGGIFENTGFRVGSATLYDPQTGHYFAEIPVAPEMITSPVVMTGVDNALYGVNSSVGTISYGWRPMRDGGSVSVGAGNNAFNLQRLHSATSWQLPGSADWQIGLEGEVSHSQSDGSIDNGDHDFQRATGRVQLLSAYSQTDLFFGYQDKFYGWPNMYTPFNVNETESLQTQLFMLNHQQEYGTDSNVEVTAYYRNNKDHYVFSRDDPDSFAAFHETDVSAIAVAGHHQLNAPLAVNYSAQLMADRIRSTTLENLFTSRDYYTISVVPEYAFSLDNKQQLAVRLGAKFDDTNRDDSRLSMISDIHWQQPLPGNASRSAYLSYTEATQVAGYTAVGGNTASGLFRSNNQLQREVSKNLEAGMAVDLPGWRGDAAIFYRWDNELTDWTYRFDATSARTANPVDIKTLGLEFIGVKRLQDVDLVASYTYLDKSENYRAQDVDASFYALNYPPHRATLGAIWFVTDALEVQIDNEWRKQEKNRLRSSSDTAFFTQLTVTYTAPTIAGLSIVVAADNLWNERFEEIPGTPGRARQFSATLTYAW